MSTTPALKANGTLLHRQLFVILRQDILQGRYRIGDRLPTQEALCAEFSVSRITVRRALADLQAVGLIRNEQGVGAFVTHLAPPRPAPANLNLIDSLLDTAQATRDATLALAMQQATIQVAERLGLGLGTDVLYVAMLRQSGGQPVLYTEAWLLAHYASVVTSEALQGSTLSDVLARDHGAVGRVVDEINAEAAHPTVAKALSVEPNSPILRRERIIHDLSGRPIIYVVSRSSGLRSRMLMEAAAAEGLSPRNGMLLHDLGKRFAPALASPRGRKGPRAGGPVRGGAGKGRVQAPAPG